MTKFCLVSFLCLVSMLAFSFRWPPGTKTGVKWQTSKQVTEQWKQSKKPILVDIYTDWCHYCKAMDNTTYSNDSVAAYLNERYYTLKVDAESTVSYNWMGRDYKYNPKFKLNELAITLTNGNIVYPSTVFITGDGEPVSVGGAISIQEMEMLLKYYGGDNIQKVSLEEFRKSFRSEW